MPRLQMLWVVQVSFTLSVLIPFVPMASCAPHRVAVCRLWGRQGFDADQSARGAPGSLLPKHVAQGGYEIGLLVRLAQDAKVVVLQILSHQFFGVA
jgi:hypothetical protein